MPLYNPYRNYDKGMDDAYMGIEPQNPGSQQYMEGYERSEQLHEEQTREEQLRDDINEELNGEFFD